MWPLNQVLPCPPTCPGGTPILHMSASVPGTTICRCFTRRRRRRGQRLDEIARLFDEVQHSDQGLQHARPFPLCVVSADARLREGVLDLRLFRVAPAVQVVVRFHLPNRITGWIVSKRRI